ncbi:MAG: VWA domain-containing protein [Planctomycetales bacterium]|nr:VWA domain-containing protein [Planctomycetales bacterium]
MAIHSPNSPCSPAPPPPPLPQHRSPHLPSPPPPPVQLRVGASPHGWVWGAVRAPVVSMLFHLLGVLAIGNCWLALESPATGPELTMATADEVLLESPTAPVQLTQSLDDSSTSSTASAARLSQVAVGPLDDSLVERLEPLAPRRSPAGEVVAMLAGNGTGGGGGSAGETTAATAGQGERGDYGAEFFGIRAGGKRFVFVVDSSRSMSGRRWVLACRELLESVGRLSDRQSFYVIFFDAQTQPMFTNRVQEDLLPATDQNRTKLKRWISSISFGNDTLPATAMQIALKLEPDAIFMLSDGEFHDQTASMLRAFNQVQTGDGPRQALIPIHTIGFHSHAAIAILRPLAEENGGTFRFIPNPRDQQFSRVQR